MTDDTDTPDDADEARDDDWTDGLPDGDAEGQAAGGDAEGQAAGGDAEGQAVTDDDAGEAGGDADGDEGAVQAYLLKGTLVLLVVLGVVATLQFYLSAQTAIRRFASDEFRPVFVAAFNLVVLLAVGVGVAQVVRRLG